MSLRPPRPLRVVIADDSETFSAVLQCWIATRPELEWVASVDSGLEAVSTVQRLRPDVILLDAGLPGLDGLRVLRELRRLKQPPLAVLMTFEVSEGLRHAALDAGATGFVVKDQLAEEMELLLPELATMQARRRDGTGPTGLASLQEP